MAGESWTARTLLEVSNGYWTTCTLHAAVKLDLFSYLVEQSAGAAALAEKVGDDHSALERLLNALTAMQLLTKNGESYVFTPSAAEFLSRQSPCYLGHIIRHHQQLMESCLHLDEAVISGRPVRKKLFYVDKESLESFLLGMSALAMLLGTPDGRTPRSSCLTPRERRGLKIRACSPLICLGAPPLSRLLPESVMLIPGRCLPMMPISR